MTFLAEPIFVASRVFQGVLRTGASHDRDRKEGTVYPHRPVFKSNIKENTRR
jgi:hypothetical protein